MHPFAHHIRAKLTAIGTDSRGGVAIYTAFFLVAAMGVGALAIDVGRIGMLTTQMQDRADAGALAGATQLDGRPGAQTRATALAVTAMRQFSGVAGDDAELRVQQVNFYSAVEGGKIAATGDDDSAFIEVVLENRRVDPVMQRAAWGGTPAGSTVGARAVAGSRPFICNAPPLMICDPAEIDPSLDLALASNVGRQMQLKPPPSSGTAWAPGNYGLLALPDGSLGASDIEAALAAVEPADCYSLDVGTAPGVKTNKVQSGINSRFDLPGGLPYPAPNVINYPKDSAIAASTGVAIGDGDWDLDAYWDARHGGSAPTELSGATRYQVYLYELGLEFARNGSLTRYPVPSELPAGYTVVSPAGPDIPTDPDHPDDPFLDGVPAASVAPNGYARRLVKVAVLECVAEGVRGSHSYPTNGRYVEMFLTQMVEEEPDGGIYGEIVRPLTPTNDPDFHANVRLVE